MGIARAGTATSISGLYATGLTGNTRDSNWDIVGRQNGAYVVTSSVGGWMANPANGTKWISYAANPFLANTTYSYTLTFNIAGNGINGDVVNNVAIAMTLAVDDQATILVNGNLTSLTASGWTQTSTLALNSSNSTFKQGVNTITINVANSGNGATGLLVSSIGGVVPEVGTWIPVLGGLATFAWMRFRPRKSALPAAV
ncbi:MAG: hypothetical protein IPP19_05555 [Verrucomicrobia bacterium]|nr:hypothetical protein [Verrucomicrobiota bacterium]